MKIIYNDKKNNRLLLVYLYNNTNSYKQRIGPGRTNVDHIAVYVFDLAKSTAFYKDVMQFKLVSEPFKDGKHSWFAVGPHSKLHLIQGAKEVAQHDINSHFAYHVKVLKEFTDHLDKMNIRYGNWKQDSKEPTLRPDGVKQVYFQDPDNYWIEVNDDKF